MVVLALVVVVVVRSRPPDPAVVQANADLAYAITVGSSQESMRMLAELNPEVPFVEPSRDVRFDDTWGPCGSGYYNGVKEPVGVYWVSERVLWVEPKRETATLVPGLVAALEAQGWTQGTGEVGPYSRTVGMSRAGFHLHVSGVVAASAEADHSYLSVETISPCVDAPAGQVDWEWTQGPTEPPWPPE